MLIFLITSYVTLGLIVIAIYMWRKRRKEEPAELPAPPVTSLFANEKPAALSEAPEEQSAEKDAAIQELADRQAKRAAAEDFIDNWKQSPDRNSTAQMLHLAAVADDAEIYDKAAELALDAWQNGQVQDLSAAELQSLLNSEYWLLSSPTRSSGAGFVLKRTLSRAKRELETINNAT